MADFEVHIDLGGRTRPIGLARSNRVRGAETILFEYDGAWLEDADRFSLEPALALTRGTFAPPAGLATFGSIGDSYECCKCGHVELTDRAPDKITA
jgi:serine/threonine-protein kinase HipA